ncbi:MAG: peroxiredoxin [Kiritimatiellia bacterium]|jgi:peroxiredoxin
MVKTLSTMLELGTKAPDFQLIDVISGNRVTLGDFGGRKGLLTMFICAHCPFVKHIDEALAALGTDYIPQGLGIVAISSNDVEHYPDDAPEKLIEQANKNGFTFPYLFDEHQQMAKAYSAACTPDFFLFDADFSLVYRGQLDDSRPQSDIPVTGADLRAAIDALLVGEAPNEEQKPSLGCNIKWKPGEEPAYFA